MDNPSLEMALGMIVFGPETSTLAGIQFAASMLRQAATMLEYRYAIERRYDAANRAPEEQVPIGGTDHGEQQGQQLAPAKRKRKHRATRAATNGTGATDHGPGLATPPAGNPLFPPQGATE